MEEPRISQGEVPLDAPSPSPSPSSQPNPPALDRPSLLRPASHTERRPSSPSPPRLQHQRRQHHHNLLLQQQHQQRHQQPNRQHVAPLDSLARKLSQQSLRPQARQRPSSHRLPRPPVSSIDRDDFTMEIDAPRRPPCDFLDIGNSSRQITPQRREPGPVNSPHADLAFRAASMSSGRTMREPQTYMATTIRHSNLSSTEHAPLEADSSSFACGELVPDEGYCEGDDDFSWMEDYPILAADVSGAMRSNGILRWRTSSEAALRCPKVVRHAPRMRKRNQQKREHRLRSSTMTSTSAAAPDAPVHVSCT